MTANIQVLGPDGKPLNATPSIPRAKTSGAIIRKSGSTKSSPRAAGMRSDARSTARVGSFPDTTAATPAAFYHQQWGAYLQGL